VKPSNIVYVGGVPKLADIGLVTEAQGANTFVGTEGFIPPEGPTSPQTDLYALGKVLYEAAMGKDRHEFPEPFTQIGTDRESVALMELNAVLLRACAPDPKKRYASAEEMHADLALLHSGGSVKRRHQFDRQFQVAKQVGAVAVAATLLIGGAWLWQRQQTQKMTRLAEEKSVLATEKTKLADNLAKLDAENRNRIVRLDIANGVRLLDEGDPAGALLWFADALPLLINNPAQESIHRIRIAQILKAIPPSRHVLPHEQEVSAVAFSDDGRRIVTSSVWGYVRVWDAVSGMPLGPPAARGVHALPQTRFTHDGKAVFVSSLPPAGLREEPFPTELVALSDTETGRRIVSLSATNYVRGDLSPDDRWLVTADSAHTVHVHDARDGRLLTDLHGHTHAIHQFAFSTNGPVLAAASTNGVVRFWRLPSGEPLGVLPRFEQDLGPIALNPAGDLLATATVPRSENTSRNVVLQTWEVPSGAPVGPPLEFAVESIGVWFVSPGGTNLCVVSTREARLFDPRTHEPRSRPVPSPDGTQAFAGSQDGRRIAFIGQDGVYGAWNYETGEQELPHCLQGRQIKDVTYSPDGTQLLTAGLDGTVTLLPAGLPKEDGSHRFEVGFTEGSPKPLLEWRRFTADWRYFLLKFKDETLRVVDFEHMTDRKIDADKFTGLSAIQWTFDGTGRRLAIWYSGAGTNLVELLTDQDHGTTGFVLPHPDKLIDKMLFTTDGSRLITPSNDGKIRFWRTTDGTLERAVTLPLIGSPILCPDGRRAFAVSADTRQFALFDLTDGSQITLVMPPLILTAFCLDPTGERWASAGEVPWSRIWSTRTGEPLTPPLNHGGEVRWVDWSPDGKRLVTAGLTPELKVWDAATGEQVLAPLRLGSKPLETGLWSIDGRFIVARSDENAVRVWDAATGEPVTPILRHEGYVRMARMVTNNRLITLSLPDQLRAWDLAETKLPADVITDYARLVSGRRFNAVGVAVPLSASELADLSRSLRQRAPELFR
jgi:WD40 repeat protein